MKKKHIRLKRGRNRFLVIFDAKRSFNHLREMLHVPHLLNVHIRILNSVNSEAALSAGNSCRSLISLSRITSGT